MPIAVANFDRTITRTRTAAVIYPPFRLSEQVADVDDRQALFSFVRRCGEHFGYYVREAIQLAETGSLPSETEETRDE